jgi:hypothetical protein
MPIDVTCDCGKGFKVPDSFAGKKVRCPSCQVAIAVGPAMEDEPASAPPPAAAVASAPLVAVAPPAPPSAPSRLTPAPWYYAVLGVAAICGVVAAIGFYLMALLALFEKSDAFTGEPVADWFRTLRFWPNFVTGCSLLVGSTSIMLAIDIGLRLRDIARK